ncbi:LacI family DNA-binding transcriptional regulator [Tunturiibacter gelidiferens]|uniref:LacI family DNA-binding transcriptional regulator n=1 Tax=Tunturiibacter gelidiferens TaxID=3069689 RepID=UPI003D9B1B8C
MRQKAEKSGPKKPATMRDVAGHAGVSVATVSRALDGSSLVTEETALAVRRAVAKLNFVPNISARTLKYGQSHAIGVIVPDLTNPFFSEFLREFEALASANGQVVLLANAEASVGGALTSVRQLLMRLVDGVVVLPSLDELEPYQLLTLRKVPTVAIDSRRTGPSFSDVSLMHEEGMRQAIGYLKDLGHRKIAFIGGSPGLMISKLRLDAFQASLKMHGITVRQEYVRYGNYRADGGDRELRNLMLLADRPTAVIGVNDLTALGALRAARTLNISVPNEVSVIGFDGIELDDLVSPSLTTMSVSRKLIAQSCHGALEEMRVGRSGSGRQIYIPVELIVRQSTGRPLRKMTKSR